MDQEKKEWLTQSVKCTKSLVPFRAELPAEGTLLVPDTKPDVGEVLMAHAQAVLDKAECDGGKLILSGRVLYTVLYRPEEGERAVSSVSGSLSFSRSDTVEGLMDDTPVSFFVNVPYIEAAALNSRKLSVRAVAEVTAKRYENQTLTMLQNAQEGVLEQTADAQGFELALLAQSRIRLSERIDLSNGEDEIEELLFSQASVRDYTVKIVENKAVIKGTLSLSFLYQAGEDGVPSYREEEIEIAEIQDLPGLHPEQNCRFDLRVEELTAELSMQDGEEGGAVMTEVCLLFSAEAADPVFFTAVSDCYLPGVATNTQEASYTVQEVLPVKQMPLSVRERFTLPADRSQIQKVLWLSAEPSVTTVDNTAIEGEIAMKLLYLDVDGIVHTALHEVPFKAASELPAQAKADACVRSTRTEYVLLGDNALEVRMDLALTVGGICEQTVCAVTALLESEIEQVPRPSVVICFTLEGDTLWSVAKRYMTTKEDIISANALAENAAIEPGQRLLIPRAHAK